MEDSSIALLLGALLAATSVALGAKYKQGRGKDRQLNNLLAELIKAAQDDDISARWLSLTSGYSVFLG